MLDRYIDRADESFKNGMYMKEEQNVLFRIFVLPKIKDKKRFGK